MKTKGEVFYGGGGNRSVVEARKRRSFHESNLNFRNFDLKTFVSLIKEERSDFYFYFLEGWFMFGEKFLMVMVKLGFLARMHI